MRYRHRNIHQVYWPAFADILTVVIVVLVCTLALKDRPEVAPTFPGKPAGKPSVSGTGVPQGPPEPTFAEYLGSLRDARGDCLLRELRKANLLLSGEVCSFRQPGSAECAEGTLRLTQKLELLDPNILSRRARLDLVLQIRALTELGGEHSPRVRQALADAQSALRKVSVWAGRMRDESYQERPRAGAGRLLFEFDYQLQATEREIVRRKWDVSDWADLQARRTQARNCETK